MLPERPSELVVDQPDEAGDRLQVEQVGRGGLIFRACYLVRIGVVQDPDVIVSRSVVECQAGAASSLRDRRQVMPRRQGRLLSGHQHLVVEATCLQRRIRIDHLVY